MAGWTAGFPYHGEKFYDAVKRTSPDVEWIEYPDEGHGWTRATNRVDFWGRVENFFRKISASPDPGHRGSAGGK
jgi:dipeptidyl aminopeptidase/acylaminoacyl peptidase